jgi:hypothetical protein
MTEAEWLACAEPKLMVVFLRGKASDRKSRLLACACCRRIQSVLRGKRNRQILEANEDYADGVLSRAEMDELRGRWYVFDYPFPLRGTGKYVLANATMTHGTHLNCELNRADETAIRAAEASRRREAERTIQAGLIREIFGNPFRPLTLCPGWRTPTVLALAGSLYENRFADPHALPVLADALEDAGCDNAELLSHLRGPGPHVRGCWALDVLLGKS